MILEGIVTTISTDGTINIAPMGPLVEPDMREIVLRPFPTSQTYQNLAVHGEGVLHITDDVLLLAKSALGQVEPVPALLPAQTVKGFVLADACRYYEFQVTNMDDSEPRIRIQAKVVFANRLRDFFGFNRAKHAVVEAAILATRTDFLPINEIRREFAKFKTIIDKTGGAQEHQAFSFLQSHIDQAAKKRMPS